MGAKRPKKTCKELGENICLTRKHWPKAKIYSRLYKIAIILYLVSRFQIIACILAQH